MSIGVICPVCSTPARVPDSAAGCKGRCRKCGAAVRVPGSSAACSGCGASLLRTARFPGPDGHHYCQRCWERLGQRQSRDAAAAAPAAAGEFQHYQQDGLDLEYPAGWRLQQAASADQPSSLHLSSPLADELASPSAQMLIQFLNDPYTKTLDKLMENALVALRQSKPGFVFRSRVTTRRHLLSGRGVDAVYCPMGGFEYDCRLDGLPVHEQLLIIADGHGPLIAITCTASGDAWASQKTAFERIVQSLRIGPGVLFPLASGAA